MRSHYLAALAVLAATASGLRLPAAPRAGRVVACAAAEPAAEQPKIISFSERALQQLDGMKAGQPDGQVVLRMGVRAGGCSGMSYVMDLTKPEDVDENDTIVELGDDMKCVIDPKSLMFLYGMQLDYSDELIGGGFSFSNPNAEETCGCGKSFGI